MMHRALSSKSQNNFCSFRRVIWLLTQCSKLVSFFTLTNNCTSKCNITRQIPHVITLLKYSGKAKIV